MSILRYSVVRYVPAPAREEHLNIGVIVASQEAGTALSKFTRDWGRPRRFGKEDIGFLREFAHKMEKELPQEKELFTHPFSSADLEKLSAEWRNSIQFSEPRASIEKDPHVLMQQLFDQFVKEQTQRKFAPRKSQAISEAKKEIASRLRARSDGRKGAPTVVSHEIVHGQFGPHKFDLVVQNGKPLLCLDAISVEEEEAGFDEHVRATGWDLLGVRKARRELELGVMLVDASKKQLEQTRRLFKTLRTAVFKKSELPEWADKALNKIAGRPRQLQIPAKS